MNATVLNPTNRCYLTLSRHYKGNYDVNSKRIFTTKTNSFVYHHDDPSRNIAMNSEHEHSQWDPRSAVVYPNIISEIDEDKLLSILASKFQRYVGLLSI